MFSLADLELSEREASDGAVSCGILSLPDSATDAKSEAVDRVEVSQLVPVRRRPGRPRLRSSPRGPQPPKRPRGRPRKEVVTKSPEPPEPESQVALVAVHDAGLEVVLAAAASRSNPDITESLEKIMEHTLGSTCPDVALVGQV